MSKHTPGPWSVYEVKSEYERRNFDRSFGSISQKTGNPIHLGRVYNVIGVDIDANAHLIAAAPDMLEALELCENALVTGAQNDAAEALEAALGALAKARGE